MAQTLDIRWLRLGEGSVRHAAIAPTPYHLAKADEIGVQRSSNLRRHLTFCGRWGFPNMARFVKSWGGQTQRFDPANMPKCRTCQKVLHEIVHPEPLRRTA